MQTAILVLAGFFYGMAYRDLRSFVALQRYLIEDEVIEKSRYIRRILFFSFVASFIVLLFGDLQNGF